MFCKKVASWHVNMPTVLKMGKRKRDNAINATPLQHSNLKHKSNKQLKALKTIKLSSHTKALLNHTACSPSKSRDTISFITVCTLTSSPSMIAHPHTLPSTPDPVYHIFSLFTGADNDSGTIMCKK
jgi:hypothetical protein